MAMSNRISALCKFGLTCNRGDACQFQHPEREVNPSSIHLPPNYGDDKSTKASNYPYQQLHSPQNNRSRPPSHSRRPRSGAHLLVATQNVNPLVPTVPPSKTHRFNSANRLDRQLGKEQPSVADFNLESNRRSRTYSRNHRSNSKGRRSNANVPQLPLPFEEIKKNIKILYEDDISEAREEHELRIAQQYSLLDDFDDEETRAMKEALFQELKDQLEVFNTMILSLSSMNPSTLIEAQNHFNALKREIKRIKTHLPIYARRLDLIFTIASFPVIILKADTGSGKSTQLVQYLLDAGLAKQGQIVCTQPRRLAACALASRVAEEFGCKVGDEIGFHIGASDPRVSHKTRIRFVTDAVLLNEYQRDPKLSAYSIVIIDEAHERRVDTDLLFGVMKICLEERNDIKTSEIFFHNLNYDDDAQGIFIQFDKLIVDLKYYITLLDR